nr:putative reverse transcriptase domain-containing protein [Tanacetum cinerariifolium]
MTKPYSSHRFIANCFNAGNLKMEVKRVTCGYPWPELDENHKDFGMIQEQLMSSAWRLLNFVDVFGYFHDTAWPRVSALAGCDRLVACYIGRDWESSLAGLELVQETTDKVVLVKENPKLTRDRQKSCVDYGRKPLEFEVGDQVLLRESPWKGVVRFGKKGKLASRYVGPFEILERIGLVDYRLRLPEELNNVHGTFHALNLKKCLADANLHMPLDEIKVDKTLRFVEEPVEIMEREIKKLKRRKIALMKVKWNSKRRPEFTWEHEDHMRIKRQCVVMILSLIGPRVSALAGCGRLPPVYYSDDDDDFYRESIDETPPSDAIAPDLPITDSLVMEVELLDTILEMDSDEEIESSVKKLKLTPSESKDLSDYVSECDLPVCDNSLDFNNDSKIFSNPLFDSKDDYTSSDDKSSSEEDVPVEHFKIYSNPLLEFNEEIFSSEINPLYNEVLEDLDPILQGNENDHFNVESNLIKSLLNKDIVITSRKIDFFLEEFAGELALINPIPPGIAETNFDPKENIHLIKKLLYYNSSPRPPEGLNSKNDFEKENSGNTTIHTYISLIKYESFYDESDSASEIFNDDLAHIISPSEYEYVYADDESDSGDLTTKVVDDISDNSTRELYVYVPNVLTTLPTLYPVFDTLLSLSSKNKEKVFNPGILISKEEKSPHLLSYLGLKVF